MFNSYIRYFKYSYLFSSYRKYHPLSKLKPGIVSNYLSVPSHISKPPFKEYCPVTIKSLQVIEKMRSTGKLAAYILNYACNLAKEGITTDEIDRKTHNEIIKNNAYPSPLMYKKYPKSICTSINECVAHGIPDNRALRNGDIINIDITVYKDGVHGDTSRTILIGDKKSINNDEYYNNAIKLLNISHNALLKGIEICKPGICISEIGLEIQSYAEANNFESIPDLVGHGIGEYFHEEPYVHHTYRPDEKLILKENMVFTIEPILRPKTNSYGNDLGMWNDNWTIVTLDNALTSQFEHTIRITKTGYEILTLENDKSEP